MFKITEIEFFVNSFTLTDTISPGRSNRLQKEENTICAAADSFETELRKFGELARKPNADIQVQRLGRELLAEYPDDWDVLSACIRQDQPLSRTAYNQFMEAYLTPQSITYIPSMINGLEEYYEDAYRKAVTFLDGHFDLSAQVLGRFAAEIPSYALQAMGLLETRIPVLPHEDLVNFVVGKSGWAVGRPRLQDLGDNSDIQCVQAIAAERLLKEWPNGFYDGALLPILRMPTVRVRAADWIFAGRFNLKQWEKVMRLVPEKRKDAWELAFRNNAVSFERWFKFVQMFETADGEDELKQLSVDEWSHMWSVGERIPCVENERWVLVASKSKKLGLNATRKLIELNDAGPLVVVVTSGATQAIRAEAAQYLLESTESETVLVSIISHVPSLRREAARKLADLPVG